jgi:Tol biopolymer transport system component
MPDKSAACDFSPIQPCMWSKIAKSMRPFSAYTTFSPAIPVQCVTPEAGAVIHRFYDTSPISPSGRYMALLRLPCEDRVPRLGEAAHALLIDLQTGTERMLSETRAWDTQLGAQVQWGDDDSVLYFNDLDPQSWEPFGVRMDLESGETKKLKGTVYNISPDGRWIASPCLRRTARTQLGYGVRMPDGHVPENHGAPEDDGIFVTDAQTGECRLVLSLKQLVNACAHFQQPRYKDGDFYGFHTKWNPQGTRLMFVVRWAPRQERSWLPWKKAKPIPKTQILKHVVTMAADGSNVHVALPDTEWSAKGGHHPNWCPDGEHILMNLNLNGHGLRFVTVRYDGTGLRTLHPDISGSGHPTMHADGRHILTDAYPEEPVSFGDGTIPIRWINIETGRETTLVRIKCQPAFLGNRKEMRLDAHPAWSHDFRRIVFNGCPDGTRRVYMADMPDELLDL